MSQLMTQQEIEYYEDRPAPSSRVSREEMDMRKVLDDSWARMRLHQRLPSPAVLLVGSVVLLEQMRREYSILPSLFDIDRSSVSPNFGAAGSETSLMEELFATGSDIVEEAVGHEYPIPPRMSEIVDKLIECNDVFKEVDKPKIIESLSNLMENPPRELISITDNELTRRIEKVMLIEAMSGMLNDLSPAQIKSFEAAAKRRRFFT